MHLTVATVFAVVVAATAGYTQEQAQAFVGAQHWWESGVYAGTGEKAHYDGYYCLCSCNATAEGVFCSGAGITTTGSKVADFLGVYNGVESGSWEGRVVAYNTEKPFSDTFTQTRPGGPANYTGVSQALGPNSFVWRGYMLGVDCTYRFHCATTCNDAPQYHQWTSTC